MGPGGRYRLLGLRLRLAQGEEHARRERPRSPDPRPAVDHHPLAARQPPPHAIGERPERLAIAGHTEVGDGERLDRARDGLRLERGGSVSDFDGEQPGLPRAP